MELTLRVSEELASRLRPVQDQLPQILELGLRELHAAPPQFEGLGDLLETLARLPSPQEILALRPSPQLQKRDWQKYQYIEHLVRIAKAKAVLQLKPSDAP